eukprot:g60578.t1
MSNGFMEGEVRVFMPEKRELRPVAGSETKFVLVEQTREQVESDEECRIDPSRDRYPFSIVWGPLPGMTCCCPCVGHMGICDSRGRVHDFAGPYFVGLDSFMTPVAIYAPVDQSMIITQDGRSVEQTWDDAIESADKEYRGKMHNLCCENCHHHTAKALNNMGIKSSLLRAWFYVCRYGKYKSWSAVAMIWLPFLVVVALIAGFSVWTKN